MIQYICRTQLTIMKCYFILLIFTIRVYRRSFYFNPLAAMSFRLKQQPVVL